MDTISRKALNDFCDKWIAAHIDDSDKEFGFGWRKSLEFVRNNIPSTESEGEARLRAENERFRIALDKIRRYYGEEGFYGYSVANEALSPISETAELICPQCGAFADREKDGIYCSKDDCSWGIEMTNISETTEQPDLQKVKDDIVRIIANLELEYGYGTIDITTYRNILADRIVKQMTGIPEVSTSVCNHGVSITLKCAACIKFKNSVH